MEALKPSAHCGSLEGSQQIVWLNFLHSSHRVRSVKVYFHKIVTLTVYGVLQQVS